MNSVTVSIRYIFNIAPDVFAFRKTFNKKTNHNLTCTQVQAQVRTTLQRCIKIIKSRLDLPAAPMSTSFPRAPHKIGGRSALACTQAQSLRALHKRLRKMLGAPLRLAIKEAGIKKIQTIALFTWSRTYYSGHLFKAKQSARNPKYFWKYIQRSC